MGTDGMCRIAGCIFKAGFCAAVVLIAEAALLKNFAIFEQDCLPFFQSAGKLHKAGNVLSEIQNGFICLSSDHFRHIEFAALSERNSFFCA